MGRLEFGPSVVPELREILLSVSEGRVYGPDGRVEAAQEVRFLGDWYLKQLCFDPSLGRSRIVCVLTRAGREVTALIDAADFPGLRDNTAKSRELNGPYSAYHDFAVILSTLIDEQIVSRDPGDLPDEIQILYPADRLPDRGPDGFAGLAVFRFPAPGFRRARDDEPPHELNDHDAIKDCSRN